MTDSQVKNTKIITESYQDLSARDWKRYFSFSTDHKVIGIQYLVTAFISFSLVASLLWSFGEN